MRYDIEEFVEDLKALRQRESDTAAFLSGCSTFLERLVQDPACLPDTLRVPAVGRNHATYTLHREVPGGEGISVTAVVWGPGDSAAPHDHHTWGLIGVVENAIEETRFDLLGLDRCRFDPKTGNISRFVTQCYDN